MLYPQIGDKMDIVCPRFDPASGAKEQFYRVYLVSRNQMESCTIDKTDTPLLNCDKPHRDVKFTFKFQEFSPNLWGLEFLKGKDYYITCESLGPTIQFTFRRGSVCENELAALSELMQGEKALVPTFATNYSKRPFLPWVTGDAVILSSLSLCQGASESKKRWPHYWAAVAWTSVSAASDA